MRVLENRIKFRFDDFTRGNYRKLVRLAKKNYTFRTFEDFRKNERFILWRHDVDASVHGALKLARIDREEEIVSTFFFNLHSEFYNVMEPGITERIRKIAGMGHRIGLHFDGSFYDVDGGGSLNAHLVFEKTLLEEVIGCTVKTFSYHIPTESALGSDRRTYSGMVNAYSRYLRGIAGYCSDSNGYWRFRRLENVLAEAKDPALQVLTHPELWQDAAMSPRERIRRCVEGRAERTMKNYDATLRRSRRKNIDGP